MPFSSMILPRTLSAGHAWLSKRVGRSKNRKDVAPMKKDTDFDPLRQRDDFQKLVAELEGKGK